MSWLFLDFWSFLPLVGGLTGLIALVVLAVIFPPVMAILKAVVEALAPLLKLMGEFLAGVLRWTWVTAVWPENRPDGSSPPSVRRWARDIFDDWVTVLGTVVLGLMIYYGTKSISDIQLSHRSAELQACRVQLQKAKRPATRPLPAPPLWDFKFW